MDSAMIAYLPVDGSWCKQDLPHMTLVYAGKIGDRSQSDFNALAKDALSAARITGSFSLQVTGVEELGADEDAVDALIFYPTPQLLIARNLVESWRQDNYPIFKPHGTIGPAGSAAQIEYEHNTRDPYSNDVPSRRYDGLPLNVYFNRMVVCWGDQKLIFALNDMY